VEADDDRALRRRAHRDGEVRRRAGVVAHRLEPAAIGRERASGRSVSVDELDELDATDATGAMPASKTARARGSSFARHATSASASVLGLSVMRATGVRRVEL